MTKIFLFCAVGVLSINTLHNSLENQASMEIALPAKPTDLSPDQKADYQNAAEVNIINFKKYQSIIGDISSSQTQRDKAMLHAQDMFLNLNQTIEVGWLENGVLRKQAFTVKDYLQRLRKRSQSIYSSVKVSEYQSPDEINPFKEQGNGIYKATYRFYQKFEGYVGGNVGYSDETSKDLEMYAMPNSGEVKVGNIKIVSIANVVNKMRGGGGERISDLPAGNPALVQAVEKAGANMVHIVGKRGTLLKKLRLQDFKDKCNFGEFDTFEFEEVRNGVAVVRMK